MFMHVHVRALICDIITHAISIQDSLETQDSLERHADAGCITSVLLQKRVAVGQR